MSFDGEYLRTLSSVSSISVNTYTYNDGEPVTVSDYQVEASESTSGSIIESGWITESGGSTALFSEAVASGFEDGLDSDAYAGGSWESWSDSASDDTVTASGNTSQGFSTTGEPTYTSSTYSASSGEGEETQGSGNPNYGGIAGLPENETEGGLLYEVAYEQDDYLELFGAGYEAGSLSLYDSIGSTYYHYEVPAIALAELNGTTPDLGVVELGGIVPGAGANTTFGFVPSTNAMTARGLPSEKATTLANLAVNNGPDNGVSQTSTAPPTSVLITLAAVGRNPTDILIPTQAGTEGSGGDDEDDDVAGGGSASGEMTFSALAGGGGEAGSQLVPPT
jgi:hypothetical protein